MLTLIANPIYDSVFKYMIANEKVAKILLSALLKKKVVKVVQRHNEYVQPVKENISICRIDFAATVSEEIALPDGKVEVKERLITIELQKVYQSSEILRFRQYTGTHYCDPDNVHPVAVNGVVKEVADPMVSVFILGHKLDVINECVCYISREYRDYNGNRLDLRDPFAESLTHDSIIVQVPLLPNDNVKNRVEELLQVINQTKRTEDRHFLTIDEDKYANDSDMQEVIRTLKGAACDYQLRRRMQLEDEILRDLKNNAILIEKQKEEIDAQKEEIAASKKEIAANREEIAANKKLLAEKDEKMALMAKILLDAGKSISEIADKINVDEEYVKQLLKG